MAAGAQHAHEGIAQRRVAQMADVRRLVGIDVGVLDDDLLAAGRGLFVLATQQRRTVPAAVETYVDVAVAGDFHRLHAVDGPDLFHQLRGDFLRRLTQLFGELKCHRNGHLAELTLTRLLDGYRLIDAVTDLNVRTESTRDLLFDGMEHGKIRV